jgi:phosphatidylserine/phosphatidylglycerophosphate/cardiolipin synthase-like enzyme
MNLPLWMLVSALTGFSSYASAVEIKSEIKPQIVQSVPEDTDLAVPSLPHASDKWVELIDQAKETIDCEQMYVDGQDGKVLDNIIAALKRAGERNVKIRFIISKQMSTTNVPTLEQVKKIKNLDLQIVDYGAISGGIQHSKFWIFDHKTIYVGSQNFDWKSLSQILETGVTFEDVTVAAQLKTIFDLDWEMGRTGKVPADLGVAPASEKDADVFMVASPPVTNPKNIPSAFDALKELLTNAKKSVRVTLLDMSNYLYGSDGQWLELDQLLRDTAKRGVKIQLLMSHWNTEKPEVKTIQGLATVPNIEVKISTIPDLKTGHVPFSRVNHSKLMVVDDEILWVGTSNWSQDYFFHTRGIEIIMKRKELAATGNEIFNRLWNASYTDYVDPTRDYPKPIK